MSEEEGYLRWLDRFISKLPHSLKAAAVGTNSFFRRPFVEIVVGAYGMLFGASGILLNRVSYRFLVLTDIQWGIVILTAFFFFTHGFYRSEK